MSQTTSLPGGDDALPELPSNAQVGRKDRTKSEATRRRDDVEDEKRPNIFQRIVIFLKEVIGELKKVHYPSKEELWTYFLVVIVFVAAMMVFTGVIDLAFGQVSKLVFG
ncbi:preprotein translocase subunit SecE [Actinomycetaceae bacterium MB13-C1-2]|nr:preprotein translocase subunit SecE [Actinomycetaceae bacterium MB13-C1-2]